MRHPTAVLFNLIFLFSTYWVTAQNVPLFESLSPQKTGVTFKNTLTESPKANVLTYEYFYNGGGVATGDINNDGLEDIYFTGNMKANALYINQGNFKFKEIAASAGVDCKAGWKTGVSMADVNGDGLLDIYVCFSGKGNPENRRNKLFINNGNLTFSEKAADFGLNDPGHSTHASFFDYDKDGDLDMYLLNHNVVVIREFEYAKAKQTRDPYAGDKLFRNDNGRFTDVSEAAGIKGNPLGFGLGLSIADINKDGWLDIYVSNDYVEPDYVYINNRNGTFTDQMTEYMQHISYFSMGCDVNDVNNDEWPDIFTVDMLPEDNKRQKLLYGPENYEHYALMVQNGFYFQNMRNMLHINNGNGTYSEIGQFAGISKTDWSWAPLFADYDNDGWKDLFITNGYFRDYTNRDFLKYKGDYYFNQLKAHEKADTFHLITSMSSTAVHDYMYRNNGDLTFSDKSTEWGFKDDNFSNGASYADLDNDGDLDLIVSHQNATASVFKNQTRERSPELNYLQIKLKGLGLNTRAIGSKLRIYTGGNVQYIEQIPTRGFQSSVSDRVHVGLGSNTVVDSLKVTWLSGKETILRSVKVNQLLTIIEGDHDQTQESALKVKPPLFVKAQPPVTFGHAEPGHNDFKRQPLLMTMLTNCGPVIATGDVNGDGLPDLFAGGAQESPGKLFIQSSSGEFMPSEDFKSQIACTDADAIFFDADSDKDLDLYIVSGGYNDYEENDKFLQDRLFINDGSGKMALATDKLPEMRSSKSCVAAADYDHDGDIDLFVGGRVIPGKYPVAPESFLLKNTAGKFSSEAHNVAPGLSAVGMVTDGLWTDVNGDHWEDLVVTGEFMAIEVFLNLEGKKFERSTASVFEKPLKGLWTALIAQDFDNDGDEDLIAGNLGLNTQLRASVSQPLSLVYKDFDNNGSVDPIITHYIQGVSYPFASRDELLDQFYGLRSKYTNYASYANAQLSAVFTPAQLKDATVLETTTLESVYLENKKGKFYHRSLPAQAQFSPLYAIEAKDVNKDGNLDIITAGNQSWIRIRIGVVDANFGQVFEGDGKGNFTYVPQGSSGLKIIGDARSMKMLDVKGSTYLLIGVNNVGIDTYKMN